MSTTININNSIFHSFTNDITHEILSFLTLKEIASFLATSKYICHNFRLSCTVEHCQTIANNLPIIYQRCGPQVMRRLLLDDSRVDPSMSDNRAIAWASLNGDTDIVKMLMRDDRVDPSANNNVALSMASFVGNVNVVKELLKDSRVDATVGISEAVIAGHSKVLRVLLLASPIDSSSYYANDIYMAKSGHLEDVVKRMIRTENMCDCKFI
mmetsp:Transcript_16566/g.20630  ORF Transcript_16566/g.20630 Transcript_16566/m.20630 type:complete len:211 (+) Transcript_16566:70-702(+)